MFTGVVEETGTVLDRTDLPEALRLTVRGELTASDAAPGDSIAVNGVCLTVVEATGDVFVADVMRETLQRSTFAKIEHGQQVNLERAMRVDGRLHGHIVQGHVDGTAVLLSVEPSEYWQEYWFSLPADLARYVAEKGSIAVDGVSLTVSGLTHDDDGHKFRVSLIPTTLSATTLGLSQPGTAVNLEVDVIAKYLQRLTTV